MFHYARAMLGRKNAPPVTVSMSPGTQSASGTLAAKTFAAETITVSGGTASSYTWGFTDSINGSWTINSGQGTATAAPRVASVPSGEEATTTVYCDVVVGGVTHRRTANLSYIREL